MVPEQRLQRVLAWLVKEEGVDPAAIERACESARTMRLGEYTSLDGDPLRRAFVMEQAERALRR